MTTGTSLLEERNHEAIPSRLWLTLIGALVMFAVSLAYLALQPELQLVEPETTFVHH